MSKERKETEIRTFSRSSRSRLRVSSNFHNYSSGNIRGKLNRNFRPAAAKRRGMYIKQQYLKHNRLFHQRLVSVPTPSHSSEHLKRALFSRPLCSTFSPLLLGLSRSLGLFSLLFGLSFRVSSTTPPFRAYVNGIALQLTSLSTGFSLIAHVNSLRKSFRARAFSLHFRKFLIFALLCECKNIFFCSQDAVIVHENILT